MNYDRTFQGRMCVHAHVCTLRSVPCIDIQRYTCTCTCTHKQLTLCKEAIVCARNLLLSLIKLIRQSTRRIHHLSLSSLQMNTMLYFCVYSDSISLPYFNKPGIYLPVMSWEYSSQMEAVDLVRKVDVKRSLPGSQQTHTDTRTQMHKCVCTLLHPT